MHNKDSISLLLLLFSIIAATSVEIDQDIIFHIPNQRHNLIIEIEYIQKTSGTRLPTSTKVIKAV